MLLRQRAIRYALGKERYEEIKDQPEMIDFLVGDNLTGLKVDIYEAAYIDGF